MSTPMPTAPTFSSRQLFDQMFDEAKSGVMGGDTRLREDVWVPFRGAGGEKHPQELLLETEADEIGFGGAAGGGKTYSIIGLALTQHIKSLILRRESTQLTEVEEKFTELLEGKGKINLNKKTYQFTTHDGKEHRVKLGGMDQIKDWTKYQGNPNDLIAFDELTHFAQAQWRSLFPWCRTDVVGQKTRYLATLNPPTKPGEVWVMDEFAPWVDVDFYDPAEPGEVRYYLYMEDGSIEWYRTPEPRMFEGEDKPRTPRSRTFIFAKVEDNPVYMETGYASALDAMSGLERKAFRDGVFTRDIKDDELAVIPRAWYEAAIERGRTTDLGPLVSMGIDPSRGGADDTVVVMRHKNGIAEPVVFAPEKAKDGPTLMAYLSPYLDRSVRINVDVIGIGSSIYDILKAEGYKVTDFDSRRKSKYLDRSKRMRMSNKRAEAYWRLRDALDPETGLNLALPPDYTMKEEALAHTYTRSIRGVQIIEKKEVKKIIGRSPDRSDALVMALMPPKRLAYWD